MNASRFTLLKPNESELPPIKGSRFPGFLSPTENEEQALAWVEEVRAAHPGARHCAWAYVLETGVYRFSDDGEPGGSAGRPILSQIEGACLVNVSLAVVRYSSGVKLGVGGLVRAYGGAARDVLASAEVRVLLSTLEVNIVCSYALQDLVERALNGAEVKDRAFEESVTLRALVPEEGFAEWREELIEKSAAQVQIRLVE